MVVYNPKHWLSAVFRIHRSDTFRKLFPYIILGALISWGIAYLELEYLNLSDKNWLKNITLVHNLLGFALSLLLVFRTNTAYDRWWEGRRQWGSLTNVSRAMAMKVNSWLKEDDAEARSFFIYTIPLFAKSLFSHLRSDYTTFMLDEEEHPELDFSEKHGPNQVANLLHKQVHALYEKKAINAEQLMLLSRDVDECVNICGACERIKNTPIPYAYSTFIKKFVVLYSTTLPVGFVFSMGYFVILAVPFIFYVLASLELIAETIENPFGTDPDDLPMEQLTNNIEKAVNEIMG